MRPFLLLSSRAEDVAADDEYEAFLRVHRPAAGAAAPGPHGGRAAAGAGPRRLRRRSSSAAGPFNSSDPPTEKSAVQHRVERELAALLDEIVARDFPFFGACYGVGTLGVHQGGVIDRTYAEPISAVRIRLTEAGVADPVLAGHDAGVRRVRRAQGGVQRAAAERRPAGRRRPRARCRCSGSSRTCTRRSSTPSSTCPGLVTRVHVYQHAGYFPPAELDELIARLTPAVVTEPGRMLANFVARYG